MKNPIKNWLLVQIAKCRKIHIWESSADLREFIHIAAIKSDWDLLSALHNNNTVTIIDNIWTISRKMWLSIFSIFCRRAFLIHFLAGLLQQSLFWSGSDPVTFKMF